MEHKNQHFIPRTYLKAWCDENVPENYTPYVWIFSKDGKEINNRAPKKIFYENNYYTIYDEDNRDLSLEYSLSSLESEFTKIRDSKLEKRKQLTRKDELYLMMFTSAMFGRTKAREQHEKQNWQEVLDMGNRVKDAFDKASPEKREKMAEVLSSPHEPGEGYSLEDVEYIVKNPMTTTLPTVITTMAPLLMKTPYVILSIEDKIGFITSDNPCVWFDPTAQQNPRPFGAGGLVSLTLEITLPLSPKNLLFISPGLKVTGEYLKANDKFMLDNLNQRTRVFSDESFIVNRKIVKDEWF